MLTCKLLIYICFNTQPPEGGWPLANLIISGRICFNTQPPEGGWIRSSASSGVSACFNTQPPEGGWIRLCYLVWHKFRFNTQPPEGGWVTVGAKGNEQFMFQHTAARRRLAEGRLLRFQFVKVSTHSRPKAAGLYLHDSSFTFSCFNTQPPEGGWTPAEQAIHDFGWFQHTAARRRLVFITRGF